MGEHTAPLGKGALKTGFGSLLGQGDFGEVYVSGGGQVGCLTPPLLASCELACDSILP